MTPFASPQESLGDLDGRHAGSLVGALADISLIVDESGVIVDRAFGSEELYQELGDDWVGRRWSDTISEESRPRLTVLLGEAIETSGSRWRQLTHRAVSGVDIPIQYKAIKAGQPGHIVAVGRDLQAIAALQQQLVDAQQALERDYWRFRQVETRYRLLFQMVSEPVLVVDASTLKVLEANPAAGQLLGATTKRVVGRTFPDGFDEPSTRDIQSLVATVAAVGRADDVRARLIDGERQFIVSASLLRQKKNALLLVRMMPVAPSVEGTGLFEARSRYLKFLEAAPDCIVITDAEGRLLAANNAFLDLVQAASEQQAKEQSLDRWLGRPGVDLSVLLSSLRQHGAVRLFATTLRGEYGSTTDVEISAAQIRNGNRACVGFIIRDVGRRLRSEPALSPEQPRWSEHVTERVGRVPLKEIVRESTDVIERLCIQAALKMTGDNRASAAELLGLSRQSFYVKLGRYGITDDGSDSKS